MAMHTRYGSQTTVGRNMLAKAWSDASIQTYAESDDDSYQWTGLASRIAHSQYVAPVSP